MRRSLYLFIIICACTLPGRSQSQPRSREVIQIQPDSSEVVRFINIFVDAFSNLKWEEFSACWADEATAFFPPSARFPYRAGNKQEVLNIFKHVFEYARKQKASTPYIIIQPLDMRIQMAGTTAVVTFTLKDPDLFGRRTLVLKKEEDKWLIIHLHASGVTIEK